MELYEVSLVKRCNQNSSIDIFCPLPKCRKIVGRGGKRDEGKSNSVFVSVKGGREGNVTADLERQH